MHVYLFIFLFIAIDLFDFHEQSIVMHICNNCIDSSLMALFDIIFN